MDSNRKFATSLHLNDGRALSTLAQARERIVDLPQIDADMRQWANAGELLARAASSWGRYLSVDVAGKTVWSALRG